METPIDRPGPTPGALPSVGNEFVGREAESGEARRLLADPSVRLVILTGPGGVGKTRLALEVARAAAAGFPDGIVFAPLAAVDEAARLLPAVARAAGIVNAEERLADRLQEHLAGRRVLLVLDNLEQLGPEVAGPVARLLDSAPGCTILATSRRALRVAAERAVTVGPLPVGDGRGGAPASAAAWLYAARARVAHPGFGIGEGDAAVIEEICARLDGLPLAIELAAGRSRVFSPRALLDRLELRLPRLTGGIATGDPRHLTMRDAIAWSYDLLRPSEQALFRSLAVFAGGAPLEFVERIAAGRGAGGGYPFGDGYGFAGHPEDAAFGGESGPIHAGIRPGAPLQTPLAAIGEDPIAGLEALLDHHLIARADGEGAEPRFAMLETVREFGLERLAAAGEAPSVEHARAAMMIAFAEASAHCMWVPAEARWGLARIDDELPNLRAALRWAHGQGGAGAEATLRIAEPLTLYWQLRGRLTEGRAWMERGLAEEAAAPEWIRAIAAVNAGLMAWMQGDDAATRRLVDVGMALAERREWPNVLSRGFLHRALLAWRTGDGGPERVGDLLAQARLHYRAWDEDERVGTGICALLEGMLARAAGDPRTARARFDEAWERHGAVGYAWGMATSRYLAGEAAKEEGKPDEAVPLLLDGLQRYAALGDAWGTGAAVSAAACLAAERREPARAARLFGAAAAMLDRIGAFLPPTDLGAYALARGAVAARLGPQPFAAAFAAGAGVPTAEAVAEALAVLAGTGAPGRGAGTVGAVDADGLTGPQIEVVRLLARGKSVTEMMDELHLGQTSVYDRIQRAKDRLRITSDAELIGFAIRCGLV